MELLETLRMTRKELFEYLKSSPDSLFGEHYVVWLRDPKLPWLVAHIDTVYDDDKQDWATRPILYDNRYIWSPSGIGGDDRCGVYAVMELYKRLNVNALFTDLEEKGAVGAKEVVKEQAEILTQAPYFIEIDRRGEGQVVFYNDEETSCKEFVKCFSPEFKVHQGIFSDVSVLGEEFLIASANVSAGFFSEHGKNSEYIDIVALRYTIESLPNVIARLGNKQYKIKPVYKVKYSRLYDYWDYLYYTGKEATYDRYFMDDEEDEFEIELLNAFESFRRDLLFYSPSELALYYDLSEEDFKLVEHHFTHSERKQIRRALRKMKRYNL